MDWKTGPPVLVGEKVLWSGNSYRQPQTGVIKWIGIIPEISPHWCVGLELDVALPSLGGDGFWKERKLYKCRSKHGLLVPIEEVQKCSSRAGPLSSENHSNFKLDDSQVRDFTHIQLNEDVTSLEKENTGRRDLGSEPQKKSYTLNLSNVKTKVNRAFNDSQVFDSKTYINELIQNMNEVTGYFKEIKEGDERFEQPETTDNHLVYDQTEPGHSKPKKLFSFLKWFNKKHKQEPNLKLFKDSSATSSPMFSRKETSSCDSIDTLFSTQTVRSFAYIPPTQYKPSAPPLDHERFSSENIHGDFISQKNQQNEESIYDKRKKRRAPEPPRLSRENSLPTTLERKRDDEVFDGITTFHRRTVSDSFKDKRANFNCHVQGKRKAPPPPSSPLYPNLQKINNNQYPSLYKKKKPAPPPPEINPENQNQAKNEFEKEKPSGDPKKEKVKDLKDNGKEQNQEKGMKINQTPKDRLTKDASLSPLPSRLWYKRSHRDSTGSNIIRKDLLKGFEKKKKKESDDWMPEVGFSRRSLSNESHSKFNIFYKLEKIDDKKKEEKRKSQISILTNISELDKEAAEILRKEQAEEKKMLAANDAKYYSSKEIKENIQANNEISTNVNKSINTSSPVEKNEKRNYKPEDKSIIQMAELQPTVASADSQETKTHGVTKDDNLQKTVDISKDKENTVNSENQSNDNPKNLFSQSVLDDLTNSSSQFPGAKISKPNQSSSQARLNFFNVQNKKLNYLNEPWVCQKCTLENPGWRIFCEICSYIKGSFQGSPFNYSENKVNTASNTIKTESISGEPNKPKDLKSALGQVKEEMKPVPQTLENVETLDELRKKRMNFFSSKLSSSETEKNEPGSLPNDSNNKLKNIAKEIKNSFPEEDSKKGESEKKPAESNEQEMKRKGEEEKNKDQLKRKKENEKGVTKKGPGKKGILEHKDKESNGVINQNASENVTTKEERQEEPDKYKDKPETNLISVEVKNEPKNEKVIEAYVVTKTIVLEDIIVKKPDRSKKTSTAVQTKSSLPATSDQVIPPRRTKKIAFGSTQTEQGKEPESSSGNEAPQNEEDDYLEELTNKLTQAEGLADFRAKIQRMPPNTEMNTVAVNRLLRKLEAAINCGDHFVAASLAKELALMKINCSVTRQVTPSPSTSKITIDLYIEDKVSHQGPIPLEVSPTMSLLQLKKKIHQELGIPLEVQRWILGKKLAKDDQKTLESEGVTNDYCPVFLYLVAPDNRKTYKESPPKVESSIQVKPIEVSQPIEDSPGPKTKCWYYNYEEDHYSYCEDSDDESNGSGTELSYETKQISKKKENTIEIQETDLKKTETESVKQPGRPVIDLKSKVAENETQKELKFISVNFVKKKVEKLNKAFAENSRAVKPQFRSSRSPETWKCGACNIVNLKGRLTCQSCNARKNINAPNNRNIHNEKGEEQTKKDATTVAENIHYKTLMELQEADLVPNNEPFNCSVCLTDCGVGEGVTLKDCLHTFCRTCLVGTVQYSEDAEVKCPYLDEMYSCPSVMQQREIKALVPQGIFELHLAKSVKEAENKIGNAFHCKTPDCKGWCIYEDNVNEFRCPVCKFTNCLTCQAIHNGVNCKEYQERMKDASETDVDAKKTRDMLNEMVAKGEAMACPKCQVVLMKKWGCDWLKCSMCKTEICWVTRGFRWGPEGKGDTSGGCRCGVNGVKCHPKCNYCH